MAKPEEDREKEIWGTWEELLLACAVNRHGTKNWDSVAMEIRTRSSAPHFLLTPLNCKQKYHDLHGRFSAQDDKIDDTENESDHKIDDKISWLEELRKRRVAELKREVQRYDVSIVSLQLKVKRLKEERERSVGEEDSDVKPDLEKESDDDQKQERDDKPVRSSPATVEGNPVSSEESGRENQSFNESNSTDQKAVKREAGVHESEKEQEPRPESESVPGSSKTAAGEPDPNSPGNKLVAEGSYNGSSDTVAKDSTTPVVEKSSEAFPTRKPGDSPELWESVAESKGGEDEGAKENSDVQSSASLSKKNRRIKEVSASSGGGGGGGDDEPETEEVSPAIERASVESEPLISILEIIKCHKHGSVFERRQDSQDTAQYKTLIRQHLDLRMVETRLKEGWYSGSSNKFFRDILLLFNNAIVFFPKNSTEFAAAIELRDLVSKRITPTTALSTQPPEEPTPLATEPTPSIPKPDPEPSDSLLAKQKSSGPMIVCRKRSSIAAKASTATTEKKGAPVEAKKPVADRKQQPDNASKSQIVVEEQSVVNERKRDGSVSGTRSSRSNAKNRNNANNPTKNSNLINSQNPSSSTNLSTVAKGQTADDSSDTKAEKEKKNNKNNSNNVTTVAKKRSVANFLNRMKRNSSSNNGTLLETLKSSDNSGTTSGKGGGGAAEQKRGGGGSRSTGEGRKEHGSRQSSSAKQAQEQSSPAKRSVGRPPKRSSAAPPPPAPSKRTREAVETETVASRQPRKRSRR